MEPWERTTQANQERLTVAQAATRLGITEGAVRSRIKRGTLRTMKEGGTVFVLLGGGTSKANQTTNTSVPGDQSALIEALRDQIEDLRRERDEWREQARTTDRLLSAAMERIPQLEAPREASEAAETVEEAPDKEPPRSGTGEAEVSAVGLSEAEPSLLWEHVAVVILSLLSYIADVVLAQWVDFSGAWSVYIFAGSLVLGWIAIPAVFGFRLGRKSRSLRFWRNVAPVAALLGLFSVFPGSLFGLQFPLSFIPSLVYIFAAVLGNALGRRHREALAKERPSEFPPEAAAAVKGWTPRQQALVGLLGTIISALIGLFGTKITVMASG